MQLSVYNKCGFLSHHSLSKILIKVFLKQSECLLHNYDLTTYARLRYHCFIYLFSSVFLIKLGMCPLRILIFHRISFKSSCCFVFGEICAGNVKIILFMLLLNFLVLIRKICQYIMSVSRVICCTVPVHHPLCGTLGSSRTIRT